MNANQKFIASYTREVLFLSSGKAKEFADRVRQQLSDLIQNDPFLRNEYECISWDNRRFLRKSYTTFDSILKYAQWLNISGGYAICIFYPDDILFKNADDNSESYYVPRDNVIFELGLFLGALGQDNTFFLFCDYANGKIVHNPTDLDGVGNFRYSWDNRTNAPEKDSERILAQELFDAIGDLRKKTMFRDITKESVTAEATAKNTQQLHIGVLNDFLEEIKLEVKPQESEKKSPRIGNAVSTEEREKKNHFPKPLTRGIDPN